MARSRLWIAISLIVVVRVSVLAIGLPALRDDPDAYARLASNWAQSGVLGIESVDGTMVSATAFRPPLYPWLLSWLVDSQGALSLTGVAGLHLVLGLGTVGLTWSVARKLGFSWPELPACLVAVDPLLLRASQLVMTETLAAFLAIAAWRLWLAVIPPASSGFQNPASDVCSVNPQPITAQCGLGRAHGCGMNALDTRRRSVVQWLAWLGLAGVLGLSILARPTAGPWVALCALGILLLSSSCWKRRLNDTLILSLLVAACMAPWILRNWALFGQPMWATTHGGYTLLLANNPLLYAHFRLNGPSRDWDAEPFHARWALRDRAELDVSPTQEAFWTDSLDPATTSGQRDFDQPAFDEQSDDGLAYASAWSTIRRDLAMFVKSSIYRLGWLWAFWPNNGPWVARIAIGIWYASIFALALLGLVKAYRQRGARAWLRLWWLPMALAISLSAVHAIYWSNMRMRAPVMAMVAVAASMTWERKFAHSPHAPK